jgi:hypothetical protein
MELMDEQRSRETRARAETALVRLLHALGDEDVFLVVLGGLVPEVLAGDESLVPEHLGTTDVDVLLITHVDPDADLGSVERALEQLDFKPDPREGGWRWRGPIERVPVKLEFLCDLPDYREGEVVRPAGCRVLSAQNLRGTGYVARDFVWEELAGELADGSTVAVRARFAGLEGYLLNGEFAADLNSLRTTFLEVRERYVGTADSGSVGYAQQALEVQPEVGEMELRADAVDVVHRFFAELAGR